MKIIFLGTLLLSLSFSTPLRSQNIGINTNTPQATLDVRGNQRFGGSAKYITFDSISGRVGFAPSLGDKISLWSNSTNSYGFGIQGSLLQVHTDIAAADIAFGHGSSTSFNETMRITGAGNLGIGILAPYAPLTFNNNLGEKISLYGSQGSTYGFAVQGGLLQIHSSNIGSDIGLGSGTSTSFSEVMRIKGAGYVGIGTTSTRGKLSIESSDGASFPQLHIQQTATTDYARVRLTNGNSATNGRYWDIGSYIDPFNAQIDRLSFFNPAGGEALSLTGDGFANITKLAAAGNPGQPGQILQSGGVSGSLSWRDVNQNFLFQQASAAITLTSGAQSIPGIDAQNFVVVNPTQLLLTFSAEFSRGLFSPAQYPVITASIYRSSTFLRTVHLHGLLISNLVSSETITLSASIIIPNPTGGVYSIECNTSKLNSDGVSTLRHAQLFVQSIAN
ncbi:MAG: hypothetical protein H7Y31_17020 [Chitinophagaceae bacterium]|nr:hypothetical protein [Chitinophagaceae bacterium]